MKKGAKRPVRLVYRRKAASTFEPTPELLAWMERVSNTTGYCAKGIPRIVMGLRALCDKVAEIMQAIAGAGLEQLASSLSEQELAQLTHLSWQRNELADLLEGNNIGHELDT